MYQMIVKMTLNGQANKRKALAAGSTSCRCDSIALPHDIAYTLYPKPHNEVAQLCFNSANINSNRVCGES